MTRRLVHVLTVADSLVFIDEVVARARDDGWEVTVITSPDERLDAFGRRHGVRTLGIEMPRRVSPFADALALSKLYTALRYLRPHIVHTGTPKGGLLGTLAAQAAGVPVRIYQVRGLVYVTARGVLREVLKTTERLSCAAATHVICESESLQREVLTEGLAHRTEVVLKGSAGVDVRHFIPSSGEALRARLHIPLDAPAVGFVGRLVRDKGVPELLDAFDSLPAQTHLVLAGPYEERDGVGATLRTRIEQHPRIHALGFVADPREVYAAANVVTLPSHREGFPVSPLEAAAMERPVVATRIAGCVDAVADNETGTLVPVGDVRALAEALAKYLSDGELAKRHGRAGRARVLRDFDKTRIADAFVQRYRTLL